LDGGLDWWECREGVGVVGVELHDQRPALAAERLVFHCRTTSASTASCTSRRLCCLTHCASYCALYQPLWRASSGRIRCPPPTCPHCTCGVRGVGIAAIWLGRYNLCRKFEFLEKIWMANSNETFFGLGRWMRGNAAKVAGSLAQNVYGGSPRGHFSLSTQRRKWIIRLFTTRVLYYCLSRYCTSALLLLVSLLHKCSTITCLFTTHVLSCYLSRFYTCALLLRARSICVVICVAQKAIQ